MTEENTTTTEEGTNEMPAWVTDLYDDAASLEAGVTAMQTFIAEKPLVAGPHQLKLLREQLSLMQQVRRVINARIAEFESRETKAVQSTAHVAAASAQDVSQAGDSEDLGDTTGAGTDEGATGVVSEAVVPDPDATTLGGSVPPVADASGDDDEVVPATTEDEDI